ncbi:MAG: formate dehydrogenase subunit alpha [Anaerolineae bacterium]
MAGLATAFGSGAMTNSIADVTQEAQAFFIIGSNTTEQHPVIGIKIRKAVRKRGAKLIVADPRRIDLAKMADIHLRHRPGTDIALLNGMMHVILKEDLWDREYVESRTEGFEEFRQALEKYTPRNAAEITGVPAEDIIAAARMLAAAKPAALLYAMGITQHVTGVANVLACANLQMLLGNVGIPGGGVNPLRGQNNVQGACDMGALPNVFPGYQAVTEAVTRAKFEEVWSIASGGGQRSAVSGLPAKPGLTVVEMINAAETGQVRAMLIMGENPAMSDPDALHVREALQKLDFLVSMEIFLSETAQLADVVLPAASFAEKDGTFTNTERRVQRVRKAIEPPGEARPDWWIICELAKRLGADPNQWSFNHPSEIMDEIARVTPIYGGISYDRIEDGGLQWPCPRPDHPGTPILHVGRFTRGLGKFHPIEHQPPDELPDDEYPLILTTGRMLEHWHTGTMTRRVAGLDALKPEERLEISAADAARLGLADGDWAVVSSRRGQIKVRVAVSDKPKPGVVFLTFHFAEALGNVLTNPALDPVAKIPEYKVCAVRVEPDVSTALAHMSQCDYN